MQQHKLPASGQSCNSRLIITYMTMNTATMRPSHRPCHAMLPMVSPLTVDVVTKLHHVRSDTTEVQRHLINHEPSNFQHQSLSRWRTHLSLLAVPPLAVALYWLQEFQSSLQESTGTPPTPAAQGKSQGKTSMQNRVRGECRGSGAVFCYPRPTQQQQQSISLLERRRSPSG
jgi:hypothetical protein